MRVGPEVLSVKSVLSPVDKEKCARGDIVPMLRAREACCSIKFQSREWGQLWGRKINHINFTLISYIYAENMADRQSVEVIR